MEVAGPCSHATMHSMNGNRSAGAKAWRTRVIGVGLVCLVAGSCAETPTQPRDMTLPAGRWTGEGVCLSVSTDGCDLVAGCGHGQFPLPILPAEGRFEIQGTYRIEAGPISINPPPPAMFSGVLRGRTLTLGVTPSDPALRPASYVLQLTNASGRCTVPCL
jgi:hypothetical protein